MKKLLYVCEADSGGIMEYAIRQAAAIAREGVEVHFLCKPSFPVERLADEIKVWEFNKSRGPSDQRGGLAGKILRVLGMISDLRSEAKQVDQLAEKLLKDSSTRDSLPATRDHLDPAEVFVLFACYKEYFAPLWVGPLRRLARRGVVIGTIAHDPVRDFVVGPLWWHRWSVRLGYSFVRHVFVHNYTPVDFGGARPEGIEVHEIPHGPYEVAEPKIGRLEMRRRFGFLTTDDSDRHGWGTTNHTNLHETKDSGPCLDKPSCASESDSLISKLADAPVSESSSRSASGPALARIAARGMGSDGGNQFADTAEGAKALDPRCSVLATSAPADVVFLAFGQIRDGKNLDLFLRAMTRLPENVKLLVAGKGDSGSSRPAAYYQKLAEELGVEERCRWDIRRIPDKEVGAIFAACDVVLVTYSGKFRSASGVLNVAVSGRKPVLASSGSGPLKTVVNKYQLGVFVEPDDLEEILRGASKLVSSSATGKCEYELHPDWERYERENSWEENARRVLEKINK